MQERNEKMHFEKMHKIIDKIWHPEFIVKSELHRRETLFSTIHLNKDGSLELFEKFETILPINTDIREYPFGKDKNFYLEVKI